MSKLRKLAVLPRVYARFRSDWRRFKSAAEQAGDRRFLVDWKNRMPALWENSASTAFDAHYLYHVAWAVRVITALKPAKHIDISSSLFFSATLSATVPVEFYDYRPTPLDLDNIMSGRADLTGLPFADNSVDTLSCMHTVEHVGLGRYGDPIDPLGDLAAVAELKRVVRPGGHLVFVVPVGAPKVSFNAHRIYSSTQVREMFEGFTLIESALVTDGDAFVATPSDALIDVQSYGCGCFLFKKND